MKNFLEWIGISIPMSETEFFAEMRNGYESIGQVAFQCPACKHIQTFADMKKENKESATAYLECMQCKVSVYQVKKYVRVETPNGATIRLFPFAKGNKKGSDD